MLGGNVEIGQASKTNTSLEKPNDRDHSAPAALGEAVQLEVEPDTQKGEQGRKLVQMQKSLVKCMADG